MDNLFDVIDAGNGHMVKAWKHGVPFDDAAIVQLIKTASMPFVFLSRFINVKGKSDSTRRK
jgi:hypothetical protein